MSHECTNCFTSLRVTRCPSCQRWAAHVWSVWMLAAEGSSTSVLTPYTLHAGLYHSGCAYFRDPLIHSSHGRVHASFSQKCLFWRCPLESVLVLICAAEIISRQSWHTFIQSRAVLSFFLASRDYQRHPEHMQNTGTCLWKSPPSELQLLLLYSWHLGKYVTCNKWMLWNSQQPFELLV